MILLQLYIVFVKVGLFSFGGGYAAIPLIQQYIVEQQGWISMREFTDLISISQMTPGPIAINSATFVGTKVAGFPGSVVATLGCITPQTILMLFLGYFLFSKEKKFKILDNFIAGVKPTIIGLIAIAAISMIESSIFPNGYSFSLIQPVAAITFVISFVLYLKKVDIVKLIGLGAVLGAVLSYGLPLLGFGG